MTDGDSLIFIALWVLSKICVYGFLVLGVVVSAVASSFVQFGLHSFVITLAVAIWFFVVTLVGQGLVQYYWNQTLGRIIDTEKR